MLFRSDGGATFGPPVRLSKVTAARLVSGLANGTAHAFRIKVRDAALNESAGVTVSATPDAAAVTAVSGTISSDTTWAAGVFRVTNNISISAGATLTILPGVVVKFDAGLRLDVSGGLRAVGTAAQPIVFTAFADDAFGGDSNGDGAATSPAPGAWNAVRFFDSTDESVSRLEHVVVRYGGSGNLGSVYMDRANVPVSSAEIRHSSTYGIYLTNASPAISDSTIADNALDGLFLTSFNASQLLRNTIENNRNGIFANSSNTAPTIADNTIRNNANYGIFFNGTSAAPGIAGNTITGNLRPARLPVSALPDPLGGNLLVPNQVNVLELRGNTQSRDLRLSVLADGGPERLLAYHLVIGTWRVGSAATLSVDPGVVVKANSGTQMIVNGVLSALGTASDPVVFTSLHDDAHGGDSNLNGSASAPVNGSWRGIYFEDAVDAASQLSQVKVLYGGSGFNSGWANVYSFRTDLAISNAVLANSGNYGLRVHQANLTVSDSEVFANSHDGLRLENSGTTAVTGGRIFANQGDGIEVTANAGLSATGSEIFANVGQGLRNSSNQAVVAAGNWWGDPSGPGGDEAGAGDQVLNTASGSIDASAFLVDGTQFSYFDAGANLAEGTVAGPAVVQGTDTTEFGGSAQTRSLFDLERVVLDYPAVPAAGRYELLATYVNTDNTAAAGGNVQRLTAGVADDVEIHGSVPVTGTAVTRRFLLPPAAHAGGILRLNAVRESGFRATLAQVWVIERLTVGDETAPVSSLDAPVGGAQLASSPTQITGGSADEALGSGLAFVEVGIDGGGGVVWRPVTELRPDGGWSYRWNLPGDGPQTLLVRATDRAGNVETPGAGVVVEVNRSAPGAATTVFAHDTPSDGGGSVTVNWSLSGDDGAGANDVASYRVERRTVGTLDFAALGSVAAGVGQFVDGGAAPGVSYQYRAVAVDLAGNETASGVSGAIAALDNTGDAVPPEEVSGLSATPGGGFVFLSWTPSADGAGDVLDQSLEVSTDGGATFGPPVRLSKVTAARLEIGRASCRERV